MKKRFDLPVSFKQTKHSWISHKYKQIFILVAAYINNFNKTFSDYDFDLFTAYYLLKETQTP